MRRGQQLGDRARLGTHDECAPGGDELERGVRLAALELLDAQWPGEVRQSITKIRFQPAQVESLALAPRHGPGVFGRVGQGVPGPWRTGRRVAPPQSGCNSD